MESFYEEKLSKKWVNAIKLKNEESPIIDEINLNWYNICDFEIGTLIKCKISFLT